MLNPTDPKCLNGKAFDIDTVCFTLVAGVNSLSDEEAAGLRLGRVGVPQGQLIWHETEGVILHFSIAVLTSADPTKH